MKATSFKGVGDYLPHVQIMIDRNIGQIVTPDHVLRLDTQELAATLVEAGEFEQPTAPSPLFFYVKSYRLPHEEKGHAWAQFRQGNLIFRMIEVPLFLFEDGNHGCRFEHDPDMVNSTALHEIDHAVRYLNPELYASHIEYKIEDEKNQVGVRSVHGYSSEKAYRNAPLEKMAFQKVDEAIEAGRLPKILWLETQDMAIAA